MRILFENGEPGTPSIEVDTGMETCGRLKGMSSAEKMFPKSLQAPRDESEPSRGLSVDVTGDRSVETYAPH